jgi:tetratricopeptide (TPR) repeat protein
MHGKKKERASRTEIAPQPAPDARLDEAEAKRAEVEADRALLRAIIAFQSGQDDRAAKVLDSIRDTADGLWLSGLIHVRAQRWDAARGDFEAALENEDDLGSRFSANGVSASIEMAITPEITAVIQPTPHATRLVLAEACQAAGHLDVAAQIIVDALEADRTDPVLAISLAEIALEGVEAGSPVLDMETLAPYLDRPADDPVIAASLALYRARVAVSLAQNAEAVQRYGSVSGLARGAEGTEDLIKVALYEQALSYREMGDRAQFRQTLSALYARDPDFADIRALLS